ncbi:phage tail protein [Paenibacillus tyrfis]|uniref:Phage tail protein n=1 Tax=Paenibacillus tyrfis TaxID=1501230 RepID=A0A081NV29_9BACL|nr:phage tail protein [Paenibacillus tyrfis]KEQ22302.1 hypothetical protein ET33_26375 [Paenibacillus tyrfis]
MIGSFGDVIFVASAELIRTFQSFSRTTAARWAVHEIHLKYPKAEYIGPGQDSLSFTMRFDIRYGINPRTELDKLLDMSRSGTAQTLTIGGKGLGVGLWYIESINQTWTAVDNHGHVITAEAELTLKEYV